MRYQPLSRRLINLIYPLVIYMAIGMAVLGLYPNGGLMANLIEKVSCIIIMGILFYKDSKQIRWEGKKLSLYSVIILILIGICACIGVNMLFEGNQRRGCKKRSKGTLFRQTVASDTCSWHCSACGRGTFISRYPLQKNAYVA